MTEEETKSGNRLIAEFMGYIYYHPRIWYKYREWHGDECKEIFSKVPIEVDVYTNSTECSFKELPNPEFNITTDNANFATRSWRALNWGKFTYDLEYDSSWNCLMEAWKEFWSKNSDCYKNNNYDMNILCNKMESALFEADLDRAFQTLVEGIKLYNEQKIK